MLLVVHDYFETAEGGGRLAITLAEEFGADLCYGFKTRGHPFFQDLALRGEHLNMGKYSGIPIYRQLKLAAAFRRDSSFFHSYDQIVYSGFYAPMAVIQHRRGKNIYYCHTPPRYMYDQRDYYLARLKSWQRPLLSAMIRRLRPRYEDAVKKMHVVIANSENVRKRIRDFLGLDSVVVHPPCDTARFKWLGQEDFYLSPARLDSLKRVDIIIEAFARMPDKNLVVISNGPEAGRIKKLAAGAKNIRILGLVDEQTYAGLMGKCIATVYIPRDEDFGMTPVESMAAGKPVVGVREGGLLESLTHGETARLVPASPSVRDVIKAVKAMTPKQALAMRQACEKRAASFDKSLFVERMKKLIFD